MRCPRCQRETRDGAVFCPSCGAPLSLRPEETPPALDATLDLDRRGPVAPPVAGAAPRPAASAAPPVAPRPPPIPPRPAPRLDPRPAPIVPAAPVVGPALERPPPRSAPRPTLERPAPTPAPSPPPERIAPRPSPAPPAQRPVLERSRPEPARGQAAAEPAPLEPEPGTVEVVIAPVEVHLRRPQGFRRAAAWVLDAAPFAALFAAALRLELERLPGAPSASPWSLERSLTDAGGIAGLTLAAVLVLFAVYHALAHGLAGATLGKRLLGLRVVGPGGTRPGLGRAAVRAALALLSLGFLGLGVLLALFTQSGRAFHDFLAGTWVVRAP